MSIVSKIKKTIIPILMFLGVATLLSIFWTCAYFVSEWVFELVNWHPSAIYHQIINSFLGIIFCGTIVSIVSPFIRKQEMAFFQEMVDALKRISRGDFHVRIKTNRGPLGQIVESINDMAVNLKAMENMRQDFISNVSHEIQSPLTSISGFARAMIYEELPRDEQLQYLEIIDTESTRLSKLSDNLLRLSSLNSEHHPFHRELFRLDKQLQQQILTFEPQWLEKELNVHVNLAELAIEADQNLLSQVWVNLIHNAIKFTPKNGKISISLEQKDDKAVIAIADNGIGMSEEGQARIFERFFKADKSRTRSSGGSGLGLSIVHKIVEMHRGEITVFGSLGEETVFTVVLPVRQK